ncbi:MAG TPA: DALR anticodon-binding domain-containing protein, partial [Candidatus Wujingus californicus]
VVLIKSLWQFPSATLRAAESYEPALICNYLIDVCGNLNRFYNTHRVLSDNEELTSARILLADATRQVIKNGLGLLGIHAPEQM